MWKLLILSVFTLIASGNCDGHGGGDDAGEDAPWVKVVAEVELPGMIQVVSSVTQKFTMGKNPTDGILGLVTKKSGEVEVGDIKTFFLWERVDNCSEWKPTVENINDVYNISFPEMPETNATGGQPAEGEADIESEKMMEVDDINVFSLLDGQIAVIKDGKTYCSDVRVEESEGMNMLKLMFSKGIDMDKMNLVKIISDKLDIDGKYIFIGNVEKTEECSTAQVFFNKKFDDKYLLQKAYKAFTSMSGMGVFSPTEKCKTDLMDSFIVKNVLMMFAETKMKEEDSTPPVTTCAGISSRLAAEYKMRLQKYDCIVAQYSKKYGVSAEGCAGSSRSDQWGQSGDYDQWDRNDGEETAPRCNCQSTSGVDPEFEMYFVQLMQTLGAPLDNPEIAVQKTELGKAVAADLPDADKITKITKKISEMQEAQEMFYYKAGYGLCLIAGYDDDSMIKKFNRVKERIGNGDDENMILKDLIVENMSYLLDMMKSSSQSEQPDFSDVQKAMAGKIKMLLKINNGCSKESDRKRVWKMLSKINETILEKVTEIAEIVDVKEVTEALKNITMVIAEDPEKVASKIFLQALASVEPEEDDPLAMKFKALAMAVKKNAEAIAENIREWMADADVDKLMVAHILVLPDSEVGKGCSLKKLSENVMSNADDESPRTPCSKTAQVQYNNGWRNQEDSEARGMGRQYYARQRRQNQRGYYEESQWNNY